MAEGTKLVLTFNTDEDKTAVYTYNYAKPELPLATVKALATAMVANTSTMANTLISPKSGKIVKTTETSYDLSD